jgi:hypothetical protein
MAQLVYKGNREREEDFEPSWKPNVDIVVPWMGGGEKAGGEPESGGEGNLRRNRGGREYDFFQNPEEDSEASLSDLSDVQQEEMPEEPRGRGFFGNRRGGGGRARDDGAQDQLVARGGEEESSGDGEIRPPPAPAPANRGFFGNLRDRWNQWTARRRGGYGYGAPQEQLVVRGGGGGSDEAYGVRPPVPRGRAENSGDGAEQWEGRRRRVWDLGADPEPDEEEMRPRARRGRGRRFARARSDSGSEVEAQGDDLLIW